MNKQQLQLLKKKWDKKLADSGFVDIEEDGNLKEFHSFRFLGKGAKGFAEKQRYFELATQLTHTFPFATKQSKNMWKMHAAGESVSTIAQHFNTSPSTVSKFINYISSHIKQ